MRRFSACCRSQFVVVVAYQTVQKGKFSIFCDFFCKLDAGFLFAKVFMKVEVSST